MGKYKNIFLDLDGTIMDSGPGIMKSVQYALDHFSLYNQPEEKLRRFIGPALTDSFMKVYGFSAEQAEEALSYYREYYPTKGIFGSSHCEATVLCGADYQIFSNCRVFLSGNWNGNDGERFQ